MTAATGPWIRVSTVPLLVFCLATAASAQNSSVVPGTPKSPQQARQELKGLMDALENMHPDSKEMSKRVERVKSRLDVMTPEELTALAATMTGTDLATPAAELNAAASVAQQAMLTSSLPGAQYDSCGMNRSDTDSGRSLVIAADSLNIAAIIGDVACNSIVVILGEGSNLPACIAAGVLHEAVQAVEFESDLRGYCDDVINGNEIRGILDNTGVLHSNLIAHDSDMKGALSAHDTEIKAALATHDADIKAILAVVNQKLDEQAVFLVNFRELTMRTQIEADLASPDASTPVGLYVTSDTSCPTGFCQGYIQQVRTLVVQTIASLAGTAADQANAHLAKGDAALNGGDLKTAYREYRLAYKQAVGMGGK